MALENILYGMRWSDLLSVQHLTQNEARAHNSEHQVATFTQSSEL